MLKTRIRVLLVAAAALALPAELVAQQRTGTRPAPQRTSAGAPALTAAQKEMQAWYQELQQIGVRLQAAQLRAMQDPRLRAEQEALAKEFRAAMLRADPSLAGLEERARAMEAEAQRAQQAGDQQKFMKLVEEARQIELQLMEAQKKVMQNPAFATRAQAFEEALRKKMIEVEPQTMALIERGKVLQTRLMQAAQAQQQ